MPNSYFQDLQILNGHIYKEGNTVFENAIRVIYMDLDSISDVSRNGYGIKFEALYDQFYLNIVTNYYRYRYFFKLHNLRGNCRDNSNKDSETISIYCLCTISTCTLPLFHHAYYYWVLYYNDPTFLYGVVYHVEAHKSKKFLLREFTYSGMNFKLTICPFKYWLSGSAFVHYVPESYLNDDLTFKVDNDRHVITPMFPRSKNSDTFICGTLKQHAMYDIGVGYHLRHGGSGINYGNSINSPMSRLSCKDNVDEKNFYHYLYSKNEHNKNEIIMRKIDYDKAYKHIYFSGETMLFYDRSRMKNELEIMYNLDRSSDLTNIELEPVCVRKFENVKANLIPKFGNNPLANFDKTSKIYYDLTNFISMDYDITCLSKVDQDFNERFAKFYSKSAHFNVLFQKKEISKISSSVKSVGLYGIYRCGVSRETLDYNKDYITIRDVYVMPMNGLQFEIDDVNVGTNFENGASCLEFYETWAILTSLKYEIVGNTIGKIYLTIIESNDNIMIRNNKVFLNIGYNYISEKNVVVTCEYETLGNTAFTTKQIFRYSKYIMSTEKEDEMIPGNDEDIFDDDESITDMDIHSNPYGTTSPKLKKKPTTSKPQTVKNDNIILLSIGVGFAVFSIVMLIIATIYISRRKKKRSLNKVSKSTSTSLSTSKSSSTSNGKKDVKGKKTIERKNNTKGKKAVKGKKETKSKSKVVPNKSSLTKNSKTATTNRR